MDDSMTGRSGSIEGRVMKRSDANFSLSEAAKILECDEKYVEAMIKLGRIKVSTSAGEDVAVSAQSIAAFRGETWDGIRDMVLALLDMLEEQHIDILNECLQLAVDEKKSRRPHKKRHAGAKSKQALSLVDTSKDRK
jgi:hypothetical protein